MSEYTGVTDLVCLEQVEERPHVQFETDFLYRERLVAAAEPDPVESKHFEALRDQWPDDL